MPPGTRLSVPVMAATSSHGGRVTVGLGLERSKCDGELLHRHAGSWAK